MNYLKSSSATFIVVIFIGVCLSTSCAYTTQEDYFPRLQKKCLSSYGSTINSTQLFLKSKVYTQDIHKNFVLDQFSKTKKIISPWIDLEDEDILSLASDILKEKGSSIKKVTINFQVNLTFPKLPPIFLLESSFRL